MRVLKIAVWGMGLAIIILVGVLFWKVAEIYGEKPQTDTNTVATTTTDSVPAVTAADAAPALPAAVVPQAANANAIDAHSIALQLGGELKEVTADNGILMLRIRLDKKTWRIISIDQRTAKVLSSVDLMSQ